MGYLWLHFSMLLDKRLSCSQSALWSKYWVVRGSYFHHILRWEHFHSPHFHKFFSTFSFADLTQMVLHVYSSTTFTLFPEVTTKQSNCGTLLYAETTKTFPRKALKTFVTNSFQNIFSHIDLKKIFLHFGNNVLETQALNVTTSQRKKIIIKGER